MARKTRRDYGEEPIPYHRQKFYEKYLPERLGGKRKQPYGPAVTLLLLLTMVVFLFVCSVPVLILVRFLFQ